MNLKYRPEIDGLRAIAVAAVVLYHSELKIYGHDLFKGGFIGVDIFFVISGYLISSIIFKEIYLTGSFSFVYFYQRRVRRIIPVLLSVIFVSIIIGWFVLLPSELLNFSKSAISSIFFGSNFYFHYSGLQYGAVDGMYQPLLHTWSLSVEEQYYILFPIILFFGFKFIKKNFYQILFILFFASLIFAQFGAQNYPSSNFYFIHSRIWELLAGTLIAYFEIEKFKKNKNEILSNLFTLIGIILIIHSIVYFEDTMLHPSIYTISPIFGTCLIIWFADKNQFITKILSSRPFVWTGLISYSLYLWHYPAFVFARINNIFHGEVSTKIFLGISILAISILSYFFIEKPFRDKNINFKKIFFILISKIIIILTILIYIFQNNGVESRLKSFVLNEYDIDFSKKILNKNTNDQKIKLVFFGDSTIATLADYVDENYHNEIDVINLTSRGCLFMRNFYLERLELKNLFKKDDKCDEKANKKRLQKIKNLKDFYIIYGGMMPVALTGKYFNNIEINQIRDEKTKKYLDTKLDAKRRFVTESDIKIDEDIIDTINYLSDQSNKLYLIYPFPELGFNPNTVRGIKKIKETKSLTISQDLYLNRINSTEEIYQKTKKNDKIKYIHPKNIFCNFNNRCISTNKNIVLFSDDQHLNTFGASLVINKIIEDLNLSY